MNVVSAFDGMSCGQIALERAEIKYDNYFSFEIDRYAMSTANKNFPNTWQLGDVKNYKQWGLKNIGLLMGGSPCQGFSFAGKQLNFNDPRSKLFFTFVEMLGHYKPKYFLLENVVMKKEYQNIISLCLGVEPIKINSALVSAQNRKRLYWTNIPGVLQPVDKGILLKDVLEQDKTYMGCRIVGHARNIKGVRIDHLGSVAGRATQEIEINKNPNKTNALSTVQKDNILGCIKRGGVVYEHNNKSQCLDVDNHGQRTVVIQRPRGKNMGGVHCNKAPTMTGNSWEHNNKIYRLPKNGFPYNMDNPTPINHSKHPCLRANPGGKHKGIGINLDGTHWRKLTPVECERLQTVPDNYTQGVSNTQRYKMLGNGWTVDVIAHILKNIAPSVNI